MNNIVQHCYTVLYNKNKNAFVLNENIVKTKKWEEMGYGML